MVQQYKIDNVNNLKKIFKDNSSFIFNNYSGLNVAQISELRSNLRDFNSKFVVVRNKFVKRVLDENDIKDIGDSLIGPTAIAFVKDDVNEILKILFKYEKSTSLKVKNGWIVDSLYDYKQLNDISKLPGKNQLIAILMSTMNAPISNFVYACNDIIGRLVRVLDAVSKSKK